MPDEKKIKESIVVVSDKELVVRLIKNDQDAFCELYARYKKRIILFASTFIKSQEFAEDVYQDAFTVIWQSRSFLDPEKEFSSFLFTIVKNRMLNILRDIENDQIIKSYFLANSTDYTDMTQQNLHANELRFILDEALKKLSPRQLQVFEMSRKHMLSHKEIARKLGISVLTVQEHISTSLKTIKHYLKDYPDYLIGLHLLLFCVNM